MRRGKVHWSWQHKWPREPTYLPISHNRHFCQASLVVRDARRQASRGKCTHSFLANLAA